MPKFEVVAAALHFTLDMRFPTEEEEGQMFVARLSVVRALYSTKDAEKVINYKLLRQLFSLADTVPTPLLVPCPLIQATLLIPSSGNVLKLSVVETTVDTAIYIHIKVYLDLIRSLTNFHRRIHR